MKSEFSTQPTSKAISFGIAREAYSKVYIKENPIRDPSVPGPGQYAINGIIGNETAKYSMRPKTVNTCKSRELEIQVIILELDENLKYFFKYLD